MQKLLAQLGGQELGKESPGNLKEYLAEFLQREKNNDLVAETMPFSLDTEAALYGGDVPVKNVPNTKPVLAGKKTKMQDMMPSQEVHAVKTTEYIIDGSSEVYIQVLGNESPKTQKKELITEEQP
jgi:hypothetical protein